MHRKRKHRIKHLIQVPFASCVSEFIRLESDAKQTKICLTEFCFCLWPPKYGLCSCSYHPSQISCHGSQMGPGEWFWRTQGRIHQPAPLAINPLSILSHTDDNAPYFPRTPRTTNRTILVPHISKPFLNSGQANDCGSLGTQVLWEVLKLNNIQILIFQPSTTTGTHNTLCF